MLKPYPSNPGPHPISHPSFLFSYLFVSILSSPIFFPLLSYPIFSFASPLSSLSPDQANCPFYSRFKGGFPSRKAR